MVDWYDTAPLKDFHYCYDDQILLDLHSILFDVMMIYIIVIKCLALLFVVEFLKYLILVY